MVKLGLKVQYKKKKYIDKKQKHGKCYKNKIPRTMPELTKFQD
jgi:hypothetical protein